MYLQPSKLCDTVVGLVIEVEAVLVIYLQLVPLLQPTEAMIKMSVRKISAQTTIKMSLKFNFELHFELCTQSVDYCNAH